MPPCRMLAARGRGNRRGETGRRARDVDDRPAIFGDGHVSAAILGKRWDHAQPGAPVAGGGRRTVMACSLARSNSKRPGSRCGSNPLSAGLISRALRAKPVNVDQLMRVSDGLVKPSVPCEHGG
jgi:hypothetical protein